LTAHHNQEPSHISFYTDKWGPVGGDDPDFTPLNESTPLLCKVPWLKSVLPACRWSQLFEAPE